MCLNRTPNLEKRLGGVVFSLSTEDRVATT